MFNFKELKNKFMKKQSIIKIIMFFVFIAIQSCNEDDNSNVIYTINEESSLVKNNDKVLRNQEIKFDLIGANTSNYTEFATFYVNGAAMDGNVFSSSIEGVFNVYAEYDLAGTMTTTNSTSIEVFIPKRKVLIEEFTGTWCGVCPKMTAAIEEVRALSEDVVVVAIHGNSIITGTDPLAVPEGMFLKNYFEILGYPSGILNREETWEQVQPDYEPVIDQPLAFAGTNVDTSIGVNSQLNGVDMTVEIKVISEENLSSKKIVAFLIEDKVLYDQVSYFNNDPESPWYQMGNPIIDFEHNDVLRVSITEPLGDTISNITALEEFSVNYTLTISEDYDATNLKIVAMIVNEDDSVINAQFAEVNEDKAFE